MDQTPPGRHGHFYWNELMTRNADAAARFYEETLGWTFSDMPMGDGSVYRLASAGDVPVGGISAMQGPDYEGVPDHWLGFVAVDDVDDRAAKAQAAGGTVVRPPFDVEGVGRIAIVNDAVQTVIGLITPAAGCE